MLPTRPLRIQRPPIVPFRPSPPLHPPLENRTRGHSTITLLPSPAINFDVYIFRGVALPSCALTPPHPFSEPLLPRARSIARLPSRVSNQPHLFRSAFRPAEPLREESAAIVRDMKAPPSYEIIMELLPANDAYSSKPRISASRRNSADSARINRGVRRSGCPFTW